MASGRSEASSLPGIPLRRLTKTPLFESCGGSQLPTNHLCDPQPRTMIHLFELLRLFPEEAGRSIKNTIGFHLPRKLPGCPAWEPAARAVLLHAASHTAAPPTFVRWLPWPAAAELQSKTRAGSTVVATLPKLEVPQRWCLRSNRSEQGFLRSRKSRFMVYERRRRVGFGGSILAHPHRIVS